MMNPNQHNVTVFALGYETKTGAKYWDFLEEDSTTTLTLTCFMPTEDMAATYLENELDDSDYQVVPIHVAMNIGYVSKFNAKDQFN